MGFVVAISRIFDPYSNRPVQISEGMKPCEESNIFGVDQWLYYRMLKSAGNNHLYSILNKLYSDSMTNIEIQKRLEIFAESRDFFEYIQRQIQNTKDRSFAVKHFLSEMEKQHLLDDFIHELSKKFNSEAFLEKIRKILGY